MDYPILDAVATGAKIKELRIQKHLKVEDISRFMGFESEQAVYKWQRRRGRKPSSSCFRNCF